MSKRGNFVIYLTLLIAMIFTACGGGGNQVSGIDGSGAPISNSSQTFASGTISGFGSVIVNGVRYASDKAKILVNNQQANEESLHAGYFVKVIAHTQSDGSSVADTIEFNSNLIGPISSINLAEQEFTVLGHRVKVTNDTLFDVSITPNDLEGLTIGKQVLVSGFANDLGVVTATRIELATASNRQASGIISNLNQANNTFTLNNLTVNYSAAALTNFESNAIANGVRVNVIGTLDNAGTLQATTVVRLSSALDEDVTEAEIKGEITRFVSATDFDVAGTKVTTNTSTTFENGTSGNLAVGATLEVKARVNAAGNLVADRVEFANVISNHIEGEVTTIEVSSTGSIATGSLQINGTNIKTNARTTYEDKGSSRLKRFNLGAIEVHNFLKVSGYMNGETFIATKIERDEASSQGNTVLKFSGVIISTEPHSFGLIGGSFVTNGDTEIKSDDGKLLTESQFRLIALGKQVKVEAVMKNKILTATKIEIVKHL